MSKPANNTGMHDNKHHLTDAEVAAVSAVANLSVMTRLSGAGRGGKTPSRPESASSSLGSRRRRSKDSEHEEEMAGTGTSASPRAGDDEKVAAVSASAAGAAAVGAEELPAAKKRRSNHGSTFLPVYVEASDMEPSTSLLSNNLPLASTSTSVPVKTTVMLPRPPTTKVHPPSSSSSSSSIANESSLGLSNVSESRKSLLTGLRTSSGFVLSYVEQVGLTSYSHVADALVSDFMAASGQKLSETGEEPNDCKNLRRRVYDILNILVVMGVVMKTSDKRICWKGFQHSTRMDTYFSNPGLATVIMSLTPDQLKENIQRTKKIRDTLAESVAEKKQLLADLVQQQLGIKALVKRNRSTALNVPNEDRIPLPFIVVNTSKATSIECEMTENRTELSLNFSDAFEIHDDNDVLQRMRLLEPETGELGQVETGEVSVDPEILDTILPKAFQKYLSSNFQTQGAQSSVKEEASRPLS